MSVNLSEGELNDLHDSLQDGILALENVLQRVKEIQTTHERRAKRRPRKKKRTKKGAKV